MNPVDDEQPFQETKSIVVETTRAQPLKQRSPLLLAQPVNTDNKSQIPSAPSSQQTPIDPSPLPTYHPSMMFCGECTTCAPGQPPPQMLMTLPNLKKKIIAKMTFVKPGEINIITNDEDMEKGMEGNGDNDGDGDDAENEMQMQIQEQISVKHTAIKEQETAQLFIANLLQESQVLLIHALLNAKSGVLSVDTYWDSLKEEEKQRVDIVYDPLRVSLDHLIKALQEVMLDTSIKKQSKSVHSIGAMEKVKPKRSSLHVDGICCASEVPQVTSILRKLSSSGVVKVSINITSRLVYVDHHPDEISAAELAKALNEENFGATVRRDGGAGRRIKTIAINSTSSGQHTVEAEGGHNKRSSHLALKFVESTLMCPSLLSEEEVELIHEALDDGNLLHGSIRFISPNVASRTIKVEHNPKLASANNVANALMDYGGYANVTVLVDGAIEGLYLPNTMSDMPELQLKGWKCTKRLKHFLPKGLGINIVLSGIFWFVSILGHFIEKWSYLKYAGLISVIFGIPSVAKKAFRTLKRKHFDANCMMVTAAIGSLLLQQYDEAASVSFLFAISEFLEDQATRRATKALNSIIDMRPDHANLLIDPNKDDIEIVPVSDLEIGSLVSVRTGDQIPSDGVVTEGTSQIDESSLTGESVLITKSPGDAVSGGTINAGNSPLKVRTTSLVEDSAVSRLVRLVEESASNSSPTEQLVDSFAKSYTPIVIIIAILMCTIPWLISSEAGRQWTLNGLIIVVIACPCALTISTPVTYAAGLAATAQKGIIIKGGAKLEALGSVKTVVFDKTGTLTQGKFQLIHLDIVGNSKSRREVLSLLSTMEAPSSHPLAATLVNAAKAEGIERLANTQVLNHTILQGEGVTAIVDGEEVYVGNIRLFNRLDMYEGLGADDKAKSDQWNEEGGTVGFLGVKGVGIVGMFCVADGIRSEARSVVTSLVNDEVKVMMLTGDGDGAANAVARAVGLPLECVQSRLTPDAKLHCVASELGLSKRTGGLWSKKELLLFVGDGVNGKFELEASCFSFYLDVYLTAILFHNRCTRTFGCRHRCGHGRRSSPGYGNERRHSHGLKP